MTAKLIEAFILALALSIDALLCGFAYGSEKIKIPISSIVVINIICSSFLAISGLFGGLLSNFIPPRYGSIISAIILSVMGALKLLDFIIKRLIEKKVGKEDDYSKEINFCAFNVKFILRLCVKPVLADADKSMVISPKEAVSLAAALAIDGLAVGFGAALGGGVLAYVVIASLITDTSFLLIGHYLGCALSKKIKLKITWLSGAALLSLAIFKLL